MKYIYSTLTAGTTLAIALVLGSCNNAEEIKKQTADQDAKIQALVDAKFSTLQTQASADCSAKVDSLVSLQFKAWEEEQKAHHGGGKHTKPATKPKAEVKPVAPAVPSNTTRGGTNQNNTSTNTNRAGTNNSAPASNTSRGGATVVPH